MCLHHVSLDGALHLKYPHRQQNAAALRALIRAMVRTFYTFQPNWEEIKVARGLSDKPFQTDTAAQSSLVYIHPDLHAAMQSLLIQCVQFGFIFDLFIGKSSTYSS